ncbi:MAG: response regulator transcription factor [Flavobacteriales bacterium]|nr:response regulator transcription factor [Flavobacteriales bacterium]
MIRIALADDQTLFRKGLAILLQEMPGVEVTLECAHGADLLKAIAVVPVDIVLLDLEMPVMDGKETMHRIRQDFKDLKVIVLSMHADERSIVQLMELGARGYVLKTAEPEEIENAIRSVAESGYYFSDRVSRLMLHGLVKDKKVKPTFSERDALTERELEVLQLICKELTTTEIAGKLFLSPRTVEGYRNNILLKTGARNTAGIVVYAMTKGLFTP